MTIGKSDNPIIKRQSVTLADEPASCVTDRAQTIEKEAKMTAHRFFDDDWAGRYHITKGEVVTMEAGPSVGYRLNDRWSIGGGVFALYGELDQRAAVNNSVTDPRTPDGEIRFRRDDWDVGATLGVLYEPQDGTRFGLIARSSTSNWQSVFRFKTRTWRISP